MSARSTRAATQASAAAAAAGTSTRRRRKRHESFNLYIFKVLKQVHPQMGMSKKAMSIMNSFVGDTFDRIAREAATICKYNNKKTLDARAVACACKLILPGELSKHAETEANKAVQKYNH